MKICPLCNTTYEDWIDFCFSDGMPLVAMGGASSPLPVTTAASVTEAAPQLTEAADLPSEAQPPQAPVAAVGHGDEAPGRPAPAAPPSDITGIFTGNIFDDDGEEFRRSAPVLAPVPAPVPAAPVLAAPVLAASELPSDAPIRAVFAEEPAAPALPASAEAPEATQTSVNPSDVAELFAAFDAATSVSSAVPDPSADDDAPAPPEKKSSMGMVFGGIALTALVLTGVIGGGMMKGKPAPVAAPAAPVVAPAPPVVAPAPPIVAPVEPPVVAAVEPPVVVPVVAPAAPVVAPVVAPAAPVAAPGAAVPARPVAAAPAKPMSPVGAPVKPVAVAAPPPQYAPPAPASGNSAADSNPWGAPTASTSGTLKIVTDPDGATVYVNDKQRGKTPLTVELPYGMQNIRVVRGGYKTEVRDVNIGVPSLTVPFTLKPELVTGTVNVYGPAGYHVLVDGFDRGPMPVTVQVNEGVRQFKLVSDTNAGNCSLPKEIKFRTPGRPETVTLSCP